MPLMLTLWVLLVRYALNQFTEDFLRPKSANFVSSNLWSRVSKALDRSRNARPVSFPLSMLCRIVFVISIRLVAVECSGRKPD